MIDSTIAKGRRDRKFTLHLCKKQRLTGSMIKQEGYQEAIAYWNSIASISLELDRTKVKETGHNLRAFLHRCDLVSLHEREASQEKAISDDTTILLTRAPVRQTVPLQAKYHREDSVSSLQLKKRLTGSFGSQSVR